MPPNNLSNRWTVADLPSLVVYASCNYVFYFARVWLDVIIAIHIPEEYDLAGLDGAFIWIEYETFLFGNLHIVQQPEGVTLQKYPQTRLLMILVEEVV